MQRHYAEAAVRVKMQRDECREGQVNQEAIKGNSIHNQTACARTLRISGSHSSIIIKQSI